jgi:hypothetical protein
LVRRNDTNFIHPDTNNVVRSGENVLLWRPVFVDRQCEIRFMSPNRIVRLLLDFLKIFASVTHVCYIRRP